MRVLFAARCAALNGATTQLFNRVRYLATVPNLEVELVFLEDRGGRDLLGAGAPVTIADRWRFRELVAGGRFDVVAVLDAPPYLDAVAEISREHCLIIEVHESREQELDFLHHRKFACDAFVVPSRHAKRRLQEIGTISPFDRIEVAPNIVDPRLFHPTPAPPHPRPIVGWAGRLDEHKGWKRFLLTASVLQEGGAEFDFWMVGGEGAGDATVEAFLESADALELSERLRWFPRIEYAAMRRFYSALAGSGGCLLSTSRSESFGTVIAEALLSGCPVVAPDAGAIGEVAPGAAYLALYTEVEQAVRLVEQTAASSTIRSKLERDLPDLRHRFSPETVGPAYLAMLIRLLEERRVEAG